MVFEIFTYEFMQRAIIAGVLIALTAPVVGVFMVLKKMSLIGDTLAHTAFAGIALGTFLDVFPLLTSIVVTVLSAMGIVKTRQSAKVSGDAVLAIFFSMGLALGIILLSQSTASFNVTSLLFGSILLVGWDDIAIIAIITSLVLVSVALLYKELFYVTLDEDLAKASGLSVNKYNYLLTVLTGVMVVASLRIVGALLVPALLVIPALSAMQISRSFKQTFFLAIGFALVSVLVGIFTSAFVSRLPTGATIVLTSIVIFIIMLYSKRFLKSS
jgi:zinc transport system permease protein